MHVDLQLGTAQQRLLNFRRHIGFGRRTAIAFFMAATAVFGGTTAFRATQAEFSTVTCERLLNGAQTFELVRRQSYLELAEQHRRWYDEYHNHVAQAQRLHARAKDLRDGPPSAAKVASSYFDVSAEIENVLARTVKPMSDFVEPFSARYALDRDIDKAITPKVLEDLRELGLRNRCSQADSRPLAATADAGDADEYLKQLDKDLQGLRRRSLHETLSVVGFILVLALCSLSEIVPNARLRRLVQIFALVAFTAATVNAIETHFRILYDYVLMATVFGVIIAWTWSTILRRHLFEADNLENEYGSPVPAVDVPTPYQANLEEEALELHEIERPFGLPSITITRERPGALQRHTTVERVLIVLVAVTGIVLGVASVSSNKAQRESEYAASKAFRQQHDLFQTVTGDQIVAYAKIRTLVSWREERLRANAAQTMLSRLSPRLADPVSAMLWQDQYDRATATVAARFATSPHYQDARKDANAIARELNASDGPFLDATFPRRYFAARTVFGAAKLLGAWDGYDEKREAWDRKAAIFLATLSICTIALNLFGQALAMISVQGIRSALVLGTAGSLALLFALAGIVRGYASSLVALQGGVVINDICGARPGENGMSLVEAAATCYAYAEQRAANVHDEGSGTDALAAYEAAVEIRPGFALSLYRAARTAATIATPQKRNAYASIVYRKDIESIVATERRVINRLNARGLVAPNLTLAQFQFHEYLYALDRGDCSAVMRSIVILGNLIGPAPQSAELRFHWGVMHLAVGDKSAARWIYDSAVEAMRALKNDDERTAIAMSALTDLELLTKNCRPSWVAAGYCERTLPQFAEVQRARVVQAAWQTARPRTYLDFVHHAPALVLTPNGIGWRVDRTAAQNRRAVTVVLTYEQDPAWDSWYVIPGSSYQIPSRLSRSKSSISNLRSYLASSGYNDCLDMQGGYRIDFHVDGNRVRSVELPRQRSIPFNGVALRDTGVAFCYPAPANRPWERWAPLDGTLAGGFHAPGRVDGAYIFAYFSERPKRLGPLLNDTTAITRAIDSVLANMHHPSIANSHFHKTWRKCGGYFNDNVPPHVEFSSPGLTLFAKAWTKGDGLVNVGVVWHGLGSSLPRDQADSLNCYTISSMKSLDDGIPVGEPQGLTTLSLAPQ